MAYYKDPRDVKFSVIAGVIGVILILAGLFTRGRYADLKKRCTATETGYVISVETRNKNTENATYKEYRAYIIFQEDSPLEKYPMRLGWSSDQYRVGQPIKVLYDPDDPSKHYAEGTDRLKGLIPLLFGVLILGHGIHSYIKS